jgi:osmotically-inducible protein OsmY
VSLTTAAVIILSLWVVAIVAVGLVLALRPGGAGVRFASMPAPASADGTIGRQEILLGGDADVLGNIRGRVVAVLVNPQTRRVEGVQLGGAILEAETVPAEAIVYADGRVLSLRDGWQDQASDVDGQLAVLKGNMSVVGANGKRLGRLRLVCFDPVSVTATELVVDGAGLPTQRLVPMHRVIEAGPVNVVTNLPAAESSKLQAFTTDWELRQTITQRLAAEGLQRAIQVEVRDQRVNLRGYVGDRGQAERVEHLVRDIPGVLRLDLELVTDEQLAQSIRDAIARDPVAAAARTHVSVQSGIVDITGEAPDRAAVRRIDALTQQVEGAQVVHNMVVVPPRSAATA